MRRFSSQDILWLWEVGQEQDSLDRVITILAAAFPEISQDEHRNLSLGQRDKKVLQVRQALFGSNLQCFSVCPQCQEHLEYQLNTTNLCTYDDSQPANETYEVELEECRVHFRLLNSRDLAVLRGCTDLQRARTLLLKRCLLSIERGGETIPTDSLAETVAAKVAEQIKAHDSQAEVLLDLTCPSCEHRWQELFDIISYFWTELSAQAKRLLHEVDALARAYGWREADILAMSSFRRKMYLELVT
jgi:hypothetical protein